MPTKTGDPKVLPKIPAYSSKKMLSNPPQAFDDLILWEQKQANHGLDRTSTQ